MPERIQQRGGCDCQTAVCAMLADDWTYDDLADAYGTPMSMGNIAQALGSEGLHYQLTHAATAHQVADLAHHVDRLYVTIESPISERDPAHYHALTTDESLGAGASFSVGHALAVREGTVLDPKPDPYITCWHDLVESPYEIHSVCAFSETEPRRLDFTEPGSDAAAEF